jgi:GntR family transcriptional repressor for pyruvate dehydrogenase complex
MIYVKSTGGTKMFDKLSSEKKSSSIMKQILTAIGEGRLRESDRLPNETDLAADFGVSRSVVREAMSGLVAMGVIKRIPGNGTYIKEAENIFNSHISGTAVFWEHLEEMEKICGSSDAYITRLIIEPVIWEYTCGRLESKDIRQLKSIYKKMEGAVSENDLDLYREMDIEFHLKLVKSSGNKVLSEIFKSVVALTGINRWDKEKIWSSKSHSVQSSLDDHRELLRLLEKGSSKEVRDKLESHLKAAFWEYGNK